MDGHKMNRNQVNQEITRILEEGDRNSRNDGDKLASCVNKLCYTVNSDRRSGRGLDGAELRRSTLVEMCAFNIPKNLLYQIEDQLEK